MKILKISSPAAAHFFCRYPGAHDRYSCDFTVISRTESTKFRKDRCIFSQGFSFLVTFLQKFVFVLPNHAILHLSQTYQERIY